MVVNKADTIFALSTPLGRSGVAVVRISGNKSLYALSLLGVREGIEPRVATCRMLYDQQGRPIDQAVVLYFPSPASFTGEDVVELQTHGSIAVIRAIFSILQTIFRIASPGEFSLRAFLNGKVDLTRAEAIADIINAETDAQLRQAVSQSTGLLEKQYTAWREALIDVLSDLEAGIDFPEDVDFSNMEDKVRQKIELLKGMLSQHLDDGNKGEILRRGMRIVILGKPNAGKSTLFNSIARRNAAIVSSQPGTTRDVLEVSIDLRGYPFTIVDTAGIRESSDVVEQEGIRRAIEEAWNADIRVVMCPYGSVDDIDDINAISCIEDERTIWVLSKADDCTSEIVNVGGRTFYPISVYKEQTIRDLLSVIFGKSEERFPRDGDILITSQRHRAHIQRAHAQLSMIERSMPVEIVAEHLRLTAQEIGKVTGVVCGDNIIDDIFGKFCIGK
ncbi:MAG: tRNA uridine-5-carboxymethylaminomethyl(34) synthesis GTPase MnmE [Aaplasma endosymbiont of Hyalomma asiaticum]